MVRARRIRVGQWRRAAEDDIHRSDDVTDVDDDPVALWIGEAVAK